MTRETWRILIVDDSPDDRAEARRLLLKGSDRRYVFDELDSAESLIGHARKARDLSGPVCVVLDYDLPDANALDTVSALRDDVTTLLPVVVMTGISDEQLGRAVLRAGAHDFIGKSWMTPESLTRAVEHAIERWQVMRELQAQSVLLRDSERRYRALAALAPVGIFQSDLAGLCTYLNDRWLQRTGMERAAALGSGWTQAIHPEDREAVTHAWLETVRERRPFMMEYRQLAPSGATSWVLSHAIPEIDDSGRAIGYIGTITDITDRKRAETELKEADRKKDEFLATLAHELRNPLAPLRTAIDLLRSSPDMVPTRMLDTMDRQLGHMVRLVDDLLDISRISRGRLELQKQRLDLATVLEQAVEMSRPVIEAGGHQLHVTPSSTALRIEGDATRLAQVVSNLLHNAAKYTPRGGRIELASERARDHAVISVTDNGIGLPPDMLTHVFDLFVQVERTRDRAQGGLGIGLALVRKLVEMHGGKVTADSPGQGRGATFRVRLPLAAELETEVATPVRHASPNGGKRVLVVDDNVDAAVMLAMLLDVSGHETQVAHSGAAAVSLAESFRPEVVFLDLGLPDLDGYEVCRRLRASATTATVTLVAMTGWGSPEDQRRTRAAGFQHHLTKPVQAGQVTDLLARVNEQPRPVGEHPSESAQ